MKKLKSFLFPILFFYSFYSSCTGADKKKLLGIKAFNEQDTFSSSSGDYTSYFFFCEEKDLVNIISFLCKKENIKEKDIVILYMYEGNIDELNFHFSNAVKFERISSYKGKYSFSEEKIEEIFDKYKNFKKSEYSDLYEIYRLWKDREVCTSEKIYFNSRSYFSDDTSPERLPMSKIYLYHQTEKNEAAKDNLPGQVDQLNAEINDYKKKIHRLEEEIHLKVHEIDLLNNQQNKKDQYNSLLEQELNKLKKDKKEPKSFKKGDLIDGLNNQVDQLNAKINDYEKTICKLKKKINLKDLQIKLLNNQKYEYDSLLEQKLNELRKDKKEPKSFKKGTLIDDLENQVNQLTTKINDYKEKIKNFKKDKRNNKWKNNRIILVVVGLTIISLGVGGSILAYFFLLQKEGKKKAKSYFEQKEKKLKK